MTQAPSGSSDTARVRWRCRRGMKELDLLLEAFVARRYAVLSPDERDEFIGLLEEDDQRLAAWILGCEPPPRAAWRRLVQGIRQARAEAAG